MPHAKRDVTRTPSKYSPFLEKEHPFSHWNQTAHSSSVKIAPCKISHLLRTWQYNWMSLGAVLKLQGGVKQ